MADLFAYLSGKKTLQETMSAPGYGSSMAPALSTKDERLQVAFQELMTKFEAVWLDVLEVREEAYIAAQPLLEEARRVDFKNPRQLIGVFRRLTTILQQHVQEANDDERELKVCLSRLESLNEEALWLSDEFDPQIPRPPGVPPKPKKLWQADRDAAMGMTAPTMGIGGEPPAQQAAMLAGQPTEFGEEPPTEDNVPAVDPNDAQAMAGAPVGDPNDTSGPESILPGADAKPSIMPGMEQPDGGEEGFDPLAAEFDEEPTGEADLTMAPPDDVAGTEQGALTAPPGEGDQPTDPEELAQMEPELTGEPVPGMAPEGEQGEVSDEQPPSMSEPELPAGGGDVVPEPGLAGPDASSPPPEPGDDFADEEEEEEEDPDDAERLKKFARVGEAFDFDNKEEEERKPDDEGRNALPREPRGPAMGKEPGERPPGAGEPRGPEGGRGVPAGAPGSGEEEKSDRDSTQGGPVGAPPDRGDDALRRAPPSAEAPSTNAPKVGNASLDGGAQSLDGPNDLGAEGREHPFTGDVGQDRPSFRDAPRALTPQGKAGALPGDPFRGKPELNAEPGKPEVEPQVTHVGPDWQKKLLKRKYGQIKRELQGTAELLPHEIQAQQMAAQQLMQQKMAQQQAMQAQGMGGPSQSMPAQSGSAAPGQQPPQLQKPPGQPGAAPQQGPKPQTADPNAPPEPKPLPPAKPPGAGTRSGAPDFLDKDPANAEKDDLKLKAKREPGKVFRGQPKMETVSLFPGSRFHALGKEWEVQSRNGDSVMAFPIGGTLGQRRGFKLSDIDRAMHGKQPAFASAESVKRALESLPEEMEAVYLLAGEAVAEALKRYMPVSDAVVEVGMAVPGAAPRIDLYAEFREGGLTPSEYWAQRGKTPWGDKAKKSKETDESPIPSSLEQLSESDLEGLAEVILEYGLPKGEWWALKGKTPWGAKPKGGLSAKAKGAYKQGKHNVRLGVNKIRSWMNHLRQGNRPTVTKEGVEWVPGTLLEDKDPELEELVKGLGLRPIRVQTFGRLHVVTTKGLDDAIKLAKWARKQDFEKVYYEEHPSYPNEWNVTMVTPGGMNLAQLQGKEDYEPQKRFAHAHAESVSDCYGYARLFFVSEKGKPEIHVYDMNERFRGACPLVHPFGDKDIAALVYDNLSTVYDVSPRRVYGGSRVAPALYRLVERMKRGEEISESAVAGIVNSLRTILSLTEGCPVTNHELRLRQDGPFRYFFEWEKRTEVKAKPIVPSPKLTEKLEGLDAALAEAEALLQPVEESLKGDSRPGAVVETFRTAFLEIRPVVGEVVIQAQQETVVRPDATDESVASLLLLFPERVEGVSIGKLIEGSVQVDRKTYLECRETPLGYMLVEAFPEAPRRPLAFIDSNALIRALSTLEFVPQGNGALLRVRPRQQRQEGRVYKGDRVKIHESIYEVAMVPSRRQARAVLLGEAGIVTLAPKTFARLFREGKAKSLHEAKLTEVASAYLPNLGEIGIIELRRIASAAIRGEPWAVKIQKELQKLGMPRNKEEYDRRTSKNRISNFAAVQGMAAVGESQEIFFDLTKDDEGLEEKFWPTMKPNELFRALQKNGYEYVRQTGSHATLQKPPTPPNSPLTFAFHPGREVGGAMVAKVMKAAGIQKEAAEKPVGTVSHRKDGDYVKKAPGVWEPKPADGGKAGSAPEPVEPSKPASAPATPAASAPAPSPSKSEPTPAASHAELHKKLGNAAPGTSAEPPTEWAQGDPILNQAALQQYGVKDEDAKFFYDALALEGPEAEAMLKKYGKTKEQVWKEVADARREVLATKPSIQVHKQNGVYTPERKALHDEIVKTFIEAGEVAKEGEKPEILFTGGYPGSGKSSMLNNPKFKQRKYVHVDSDEIKAHLAKADGFDRPKIASVWQDEADDIIERIFELARSSRRHVLFDGTLKSQGKVVKKIEHFKEAGYSPKVAYADLPMEKTLQRALGRFVGGGRFVDPAYVVTHDKHNIRTLEAIKPLVDEWEQYSTDVPAGSLARVLASSSTHESTTWRGRIIASILKETEGVAGQRWWCIDDGEDRTLDRLDAAITRRKV